MFTFNIQISKVNICNVRLLITKREINIKALHICIVRLYTWFVLFESELAQWAPWTPMDYDQCRDNRLTAHGIANTDTRYLTTHSHTSNPRDGAYNSRSRHCEHQVNKDLTYARFAGYNHCYHNYDDDAYDTTSPSAMYDGTADYQYRTCPGLPPSDSTCNTKKSL